MLAFNTEVAHSRAFVGSADIDYKVHGLEDLRLHLSLGADVSKGRQAQNKSTASLVPCIMVLLEVKVS